MSAYENQGRLSPEEKAAWELEELLVKVVIQDSLTTGSTIRQAQAAPASVEEQLEKVRLRSVVEESRLEARRAQRLRQERGHREQLELRQAIAASLAETADTQSRRRKRDQREELELEQALMASLEEKAKARLRRRARADQELAKLYQAGEAVTKKPNPRAQRSRRERNHREQIEYQKGLVASLKETTTLRSLRPGPDHHEQVRRQRAAVASVTEKTNSRLHRHPWERDHRQQIEFQKAIQASLMEKSKKRHRRDDDPLEYDPLADANNAWTRRHPNAAREAAPAVEYRPAPTRMTETRQPPTRPEQARPRPVAPVAVDSTSDGRKRKVRLLESRLPDRSRTVDSVPDRSRPISRPVDSQRRVRFAPEPTLPSRASEVPPLAATIYRWLQTRVGPKPAIRCFGSCRQELVFRGVQRDNGRREQSIILHCGHVVGSWKEEDTTSKRSKL
ncbi:uncharacterized protein B0H64DRAFT_452325 [Chaetomium fimeti]|uniref:Uncharacterized protein n=1 Tax=Chaetomium fimeti TaxID=1854472 RepID=A0AAE0H5T6_9PEZI|nr:hypothetical protein B0H64DRAFT_452325 [Chaetomium fimeti]